MATTGIIERSSDSWRCAFDPDAVPVASVSEGESFALRTANAFAPFEAPDDETLTGMLGNFEASKANPLTGPVEIAGAMPGDTVVVRIDEITVEGGSGVCPVLPGVGFLREPVPGPHVGRFEVSGGKVLYPAGLTAELRPSIGVIGLCPPELQPSVHPGAHGGNLDDPSLRAGTSLYLPVGVPGGMLSIGDVHGIQGDSEWRSPLEVDSVCQLTIERVVKGRQLSGLWAETPDSWISYGIANELTAAIEIAAGNMVALVSECCELPLETSLEILSSVGDVRLCTVALDAWDSVVRAELPKSIDTRGLIGLLP